MNGRPVATAGRRSDGEFLPDGAGYARVEVVEQLHLALLGRQQLGGVAGAGHGLPRLGQLDPLDAL